MKTKVMFLDLDGVLLPFGSYNELDTKTILAKPMEHVELLAKLTPQKNLDAIAKLGEDHTFVLISTWRYLVPDEVLEAYLTKIGLWQFFHPERPIANFARQYATKPDDILQWVSNYAGDVEDFLVIDDWPMTGFQGIIEVTQITPDPKIGYLG